MKNSDFFSTYHQRDGYDTMYRHNYGDLFKSFSLIETLSVLFDKKTIGAALFAMVMWGVYGIPIILAVVWGSYFIGNAITRVSYAIFGTSRKVRWNTNSAIYFVMTSWLWIWLPGIIFFALVLVGMIPFGLYHALSHSASFDATSTANNLFMYFYWDIVNSSSSLSEFIVRFAFWDAMHSTISTIRVTLIPVVGYLFYWTGHTKIGEQEFYDGEAEGRDAWLAYERRSM